MRKNIPDLYLEQILLGEASTQYQDKIQSDGEMISRLDELKISNEDILKTYPPEVMVKRIMSKYYETAEKKRSRIFEYAHYKKYISIPILAAAVVIMIIGIVPLTKRGISHQNASQAESIRIKGMRPQLHIYRATGSNPELLTDHTRVKEKDLLQIAYISGGKKYGVILSVDGRGTVTLHYPEKVTTSTALQSDGEITLPYSYELDDAPNFERFYFITSDNPFSTNQILSLVKNESVKSQMNANTTLHFPKEYEQVSILLKKEGQ
ncbi:MAG: hypothetical protein AB1798_07015 [Spirochaetota bacterium]